MTSPALKPVSVDDFLDWESEDLAVTCREHDTPGGPALRDGRAVGRLRYSDPELTEALNLADGLARSPASIASFLEAAGAAALEQAGKILVRRT